MSMQISPDGRYQWNGIAWVPVRVAVPKKKHGKRNLALIIAAPFVIFVGVMALAFHGATDTVVVYSVTSDDSAGAVGYLDHSASGGTRVDKTASLPLTASTKTGSGEPAYVFGIGSNGGVMTCTIAVNGVIIATDVGSGSIGCTAQASIP